MKKNKIGAIIIAAGYSSRMDGFKPLLKLGNQTAIERVIATHQLAGVDQIILVVGHRADEISPYVKNKTLDLVINENFAEGMYTSIVKGITRLDEAVDAFFIHPVDIPLVKLETVKYLMEASEKTGKGVIYPCFLGERGHPPLIHKKYQNLILENKKDGGLKCLLGLYEADAVDLPLTDEAILMDMDTRADFEALLVYNNQTAPNLSECYAIWDKFKLPENIRRHCIKVKQTAMGLAVQLTEKGVTLDRSALRAAALLHDIAKTEKKHAYQGGELLREMGYPTVGDIIADHMDIIVEPDQAITESEILYLADKLVKNDQLMDLEARKIMTLDFYKDNPRATQKITMRYQNAELILQKIKRMIA